MASNQNTQGERIAKVIARAGLASRREAEAWIAAGRVAVNGAKIASPALNVGAADKIVVDGKPLPGAERTRLFLYHKPRGLVTTSADAQGKVTQDQLTALRDGVAVDGINYGPIDATLDREQTSNVWITFAMREGKN